VPLTIEFTRTTTGWDWNTSVPSSISSDPIVNGSGSITFDEDGNLISPTANPEITIANLVNGAEDLNFEWNLLDNTGVTNGTLTGYASPSTTTFQSQDGFAAGTVQSVSIDELGVISGVYSNGRMVPLYYIAMADFPSYTGLDNLGNNLYAESIASGQPSVGTAGTGTLGRISPNALEMSNVDLSDQFVKMITTQRAFQANARVITTSDEVLTELVNLKR
jgi:flagellar hook protein FlgE